MADLDDVDHRVVAALQADGRLSMRALAEQLHVSRANVYARVERLHRTGVITGYAATVDPVRLGQSVAAYVYMRVEQQSWKPLRARLNSVPEVVHCALVAGEHDIVLLVRAVDAAALRDLVLNRLQDMPEVLGTRTELVFEEFVPA